MSKQNWEVGQVVKVGFMADLMVLAKVPTPGDYKPDAYILAKGTLYYSFVPHNGLNRITEEQVSEMIVAAKKIHAAEAETEKTREEKLQKAKEFQIYIKQAQEAIAKALNIRKKKFSLMDVTPFHPEDIQRAKESKEKCQRQIDRIGK